MLAQNRCFGCLRIEMLVSLRMTYAIYYAPPLIGGGIKRWCASDVWLSLAYIGPKSRTERPRKTKIGTKVATSRLTRTPLSRSKGQSHQAALLTAVLARQAAAAVGVGTCWPWETAATLPSAWPREALRRPRGGDISWRPPAYSLYIMFQAQVPYNDVMPSLF